MPKSRLECCLALKKFLEYAVAEHRQPQSFLISEKDYLKIRGADSKSRKRPSSPMPRCLADKSCWKRTTSSKSAGCLSTASWEVAFITRATNDDGEPQLRVTKGKTYNTRGGVKEETDPRWLEAVPVDGTTFGLVEGWDRFTQAATDRDRGRWPRAVLRRLPYGRS